MYLRGHPIDATVDAVLQPYDGVVRDRPVILLQGRDGTVEADLDRPLGVDQAFVDTYFEARAGVVQAPGHRAEGVGVGIEVDHGDRPLEARAFSRDGAQDRRGDAVIAADGDRNDASLVNA